MFWIPNVALQELVWQNKFKQQVKAKRTIKVRAVILNHVGLPRSGKTSFLRRIKGDIVNIKLAREEGEFEQPSSGVLESGGPVFLRKSTTDVGAIKKRVWSVSKNFDEEQSLLNCLFTNVVTMPHFNVLDRAPIRAYSVPLTVSSSLVCFPNGPILKTQNLHQTQVEEDIYSMFKEIEGGDQSEYAVLLTNNDTGGHAEFMDLQAVLVQGPCFNLLYSRLVDDMESVFKIYYTNEEGKSTEKEDSTMTVEEVLFQVLSNVVCFDRSDIISARSQSKAMFVGTHYDLVSKEEFQRRDDLLKVKIKNTEFYHKKIIEFAQEDQLMIAVDNMNGDSAEVEKNQRILERVIDNFEETSIPIAWLILSLYLRKKYRTVSLKECEQIAGMLGMDSEELQDALQFLHHRLRVLLYYPEVEAMKDTVICQMQVVFDSASNLIRETFTFEKVGLQACEEFKEKGQFSYEDLKKALKKASGQTDTIPLENLIQLFQYLNVLTTVPQKQSELSPKYFMPCVLKSARYSELDIPRLSHQDPPSLMIRFDCGFSPVGIFPAMITNLVSQRLKGWVMIEEGLRKNKVQFYVGDDYDKISLVSYPHYFEVVVSRFEGFSYPTKTLCADVLAVIQSTLNTVTTRINSHFNMKYKLGFECPHHPGREHLCVIKSEKARYLECLEDPKRITLVDVDDGHKAWFPTAGCHSESPMNTLPTLGLEARKRQQHSAPDLNDSLKKIRLADGRSPPSLIPMGTARLSPSFSPPPRSPLHSSWSCQPSLKSLLLIKWKDEHGKKQKFRLANQVSAKWKNFGRLLEIDSNVLEGWERQHHCNSEECWMEVMKCWLAGRCAYENTWKGLYDLLEDAEFSSVAKKLETAVINACSS